MSAATITPAAASAELLIEMYELVQRLDDEGGYLDDLNECGELADKLSTALRRFRTRINRAKKARAAEATESAPPAELAEAQSSDAPAPPARTPAEPGPAAEPPLPPRGPRSWRAWIAAALLSVPATLGAIGRVLLSPVHRLRNSMQRMPSQDDPGASNRAGGSPAGPGGVR